MTPPKIIPQTGFPYPWRPIWYICSGVMAPSWTLSGVASRMKLVLRTRKESVPRFEMSTWTGMTWRSSASLVPNFSAISAALK